MGKIGRIIKSSDDLYELIGTQSVPETDVKGTDYWKKSWGANTVLRNGDVYYFCRSVINVEFEDIKEKWKIFINMKSYFTEKERIAVHEFVDKLIDNGFIDPNGIPGDEIQFEDWWKTVKSRQDLWEAMLIYNNKDNVPQA